MENLYQSFGVHDGEDLVMLLSDLLQLSSVHLPSRQSTTRQHARDGYFSARLACYGHVKVVLYPNPSPHTATYTSQESYGNVELVLSVSPLALRHIPLAPA